MTDPLTYVFCVVRSGRTPRIGRTVSGLDHGGPLRTIHAGRGVWLVVQSVPARRYGDVALARQVQDPEAVGRLALVHETVVEQFLSARALLPMKLFTLFTSDARALAHVQRRRSRLEALLDRVERHVEWGLRLRFDARAARTAVVERGQTVGGRQRRIDARTSGTAYLARKRDLLEGARVERMQAAADAVRVFRTLSQHATEARRRVATERVSGSDVLLDAVFLVPAGHRRAFRAAVTAQVRRIRTAAVVWSLTGPWPPYHFVDAPRRGGAGTQGPPSREKRGRARDAVGRVTRRGPAGTGHAARRRRARRSTES